MNGIIPWSSSLLILLGTLGFLAGVALTRYRYDANSGSRQFYVAPETLVWLSLICAQIAAWAIVIWPLLSTLRAYKSFFAYNEAQIILPILCLLALFALPSWLFSKNAYRSPLKYHQTKMKFVVYTGAAVALLAIINILLIQAATYSVSGAAEKQIEAYLSLRDALQNQLLILGVIIGLATLATGALRNAIIAAESREQPAQVADEETHKQEAQAQKKEKAKAKKRSSYPAELVLLYGLYYTMLLAFVYVPVYLSLMKVGEGIRNNLYPLASLDLAKPSDLQAKREAISKLLMLGADPLASLQAGVAILAPLAGSIVAVLLGKGK